MRGSRQRWSIEAETLSPVSVYARCDRVACTTFDVNRVVHTKTTRCVTLSHSRTQPQPPLKRIGQSPNVAPCLALPPRVIGGRGVSGAGSPGTGRPTSDVDEADVAANVTTGARRCGAGGAGGCRRAAAVALCRALCGLCSDGLRAGDILGRKPVAAAASYSMRFGVMHNALWSASSSGRPPHGSSGAERTGRRDWAGGVATLPGRRGAVRTAAGGVTACEASTGAAHGCGPAPLSRSACSSWRRSCAPAVPFPSVPVRHGAWLGGD